jgi:hypothetical protein
LSVKQAALSGPLFLARHGTFILSSDQLQEFEATVESRRTFANPMSRFRLPRRSKRLKKISQALSCAHPQLNRDQTITGCDLPKIRNEIQDADRNCARDLEVLLESFASMALGIHGVSPIESIVDLPEPHRSFAQSLEDRSVNWRAWRAPREVWLIGGTLDLERSNRMRGAVVHLEWMGPKNTVHRSSWRCLKMNEWTAGAGR